MLIRRISALVGPIVGAAALMFALPAKVDAQLLQVSPTQLSFSSSTGGNAPPPQSVAILATGQAAVNFAVQITGSGSGTSAPAWLTVNQPSGTTPGGLIVSVNQTGLAASSSPYTAALQISVPNNSAQSLIVIPVAFTVSAGATQLVAAPAVLRFAARVQAPGTFSQTIVLNTTGGGLSYSTSILAQSSPAFWLSGVTPNFGEIVPNSPSLLQVNINTQGLAVGSYHQVIQITSSAGSISVPVSLFISDQGARLGVNVTGLRFSVAQGSSSSTPQTITIQNLGDLGSTVNWTADLPYGSNWLTLAGPNGTASPTNPGTLSLSPNSTAASLPVGESYALVRITDPNSLDSPQYVVAVLDVEPSSGPSPSGIIPAGLLFTTANGAPAAQTVSVYNSSTTPSALQVSTVTSNGASWLTASVTTSTASAQTPGQVSVSVNSSSLTPGVYAGGVNIAVGSVLQTANITLVVVPTGCTPSGLGLTQTSLANNFAVRAGWPAPLIVQLRDNCGNPVTNGSVVASFSNGDASLSLLGDQQTGAYSATWQPGITASSMAITVTASAPCCGSATTRLIGTVNQNAAPPPTLVPNGVLGIFFNTTDAALYGAALAPGDVSQVYGTGLASTATGTSVPLPPQLDGTFMLVGGLNAPLFYISGTQLDVQIPFELTANRQYQTLVASNGAFTLPETIDVVPVQPDIAVYPDGSVIAQHSVDYSLVTASSPAKPSETLIIYLAGMGATSPSVASGNPTPSESVLATVQPTVTVDGQNATIGYAGLSPSGVGLYQINFTVPANVRLGDVNLVVNQNGVTDSSTLPVAATTSTEQLVLTPNPLNLTSANGVLTVTLAAPAGTSAQAVNTRAQVVTASAQIVNLTSSNATVATVPATVMIPAGATSASVTVTPGNANGTATIMASAPGFTSGTAIVNVAATGPASITATSGAGQSTPINAIFANPLVVTVKNASGNPLNGVVVAFSAPSSGASAVFVGGVNTAITNASGVATFLIAANGTIGSYTVTASVAGLSSTATFVLSNIAGTPASITATSGGGQSVVVNTAFSNPLVATVRDATGNLLSGVTVTFTLPSSGASAVFAGGVNTATTNTSGVATSAVLTANGTSGSYTVTASVAGVSTAATFSLTNTAGSPSSITATSGTGQSAAVGAAFQNPLVATVKDASGNPVSGVTVTFTLPSSGASVVFAGGVNTATTNASGVAVSAGFTANKTVGSYTITASVTSLSATATFSLTNTAAGLGSITATSGSGQSAVVNAAFPNPLVATVRDANSNPVNGATVTFAVPSSGASAVFAGGVNTAITNASGVAVSAGFTANGTVGSYTITASVTSLSATATFSLANTALTASAPSLTCPAVGSFSLNVAVNSPAMTVSGGTAPYTFSLATGSLPSGLTLNTANGAITGTPTASGTFTIQVKDANGLVATTICPFTIGSVPLGIITTSLPQGTPGAAYSFQPIAAGGKQPFTWTITGLPTGITGNSTSGLISGTTTSTGSFTVKISVSDSSTPQQTASASLTLVIAATPLAITTTSPLPNATVSVAYSAQISASGGTQPYHWSATNLPTWLTFDVSGGICGTPTTVCGTPPTVGPNTFTITVVDSGSPAQTVNQSFSLTVAASGGTGVITVSSASVGKNLQVPISITFTPAPTGTVNLTITSLTPGSAVVGSAGAAGAAQLIAPIEAGTTVVSVYAQALAASGTVTFTASAPGYTTGSGTVTLANSGFVLSGPNGIGSAFTTFQGVPTSLTVYAARLDSSGQFVEPEEVNGGASISVPIASAPTSVGTVSPTSITFSGGTSTGGATFTAGSTNTGTASIMITQPSGFTTPALGGTVTATVQQSGLIAPSVVVGQNLQTTAQVGLSGNAPSNITVTLTTSAPTQLQFATSASGTGSSTITVQIPQNQTQSAPFYVLGLAGSGSAPYTISAPGYGTVQATVQLAPSGFVIQTPAGFGASFSMTLGSGVDATLNVYTVALPASGAIFEAVAPGQSVSATVTSGSTSVGTITTSPVVISGGTSLGATAFHAVGTGTSTITASASGYTSGTVQATVQGATLSINNGVTVGQFLESSANVILSVAPAAGVQVTLTTNSSLIKLAVNPTDPGSNTIQLNLGPGQQVATYYIYGVGSSGSPSYSASAPGYGSGTDVVTLAPSGIVIFGPGSCQSSTCTVSQSGGAQTITVYTAQLSAGGAPVTPQNLAGNAPLNVGLNDTNTGAGTLSPTSVNIAAGTNSSQVTFTPVGTGSTTVSVTQPAQFTTPTSNTQVTVTVQ